MNSITLSVGMLYALFPTKGGELVQERRKIGGGETAESAQSYAVLIG